MFPLHQLMYTRQQVYGVTMPQEYKQFHKDKQQAFQTRG